MNNRKFSHLSDVFRFTFKNQTAGKSFKVMTFVLPVVFFIAFFLLNFLLAMFSTSKETNYVAEKVYVIDNTDTGLAKTALQATLLTKKEFGKLTVADTDKTDAAAVCNDIIGKNDPLSLVMTFELDKETKKIKVTETVPVWSTISDSEGEEILDTAVDSVMALRVMSSHRNGHLSSWRKSCRCTQGRRARTRSRTVSCKDARSHAHDPHHLHVPDDLRTEHRKGRSC